MDKEKWSTWPPHKLSMSRDKLLELSATLDSFPPGNDEAESALSRFLVVRASGHIEYTLEEGLLSSLKRETAPHIINHIRSNFFKGRNPTPERIEKLLASFRTSWAADIKTLFSEDDELLSRELSLMVDRRNKIVHGHSENIGKRKALTLAEHSIEISDRILQILCPPDKQNAYGNP